MATIITAAITIRQCIIRIHLVRGIVLHPTITTTITTITITTTTTTTIITIITTTTITRTGSVVKVVKTDSKKIKQSLKSF